MIETPGTGGEELQVHAELNQELAVIQKNILKAQSVEDLAPVEAQLQNLHDLTQLIEEGKRNYITVLSEVITTMLYLADDFKEALAHNDQVKNEGAAMRIVLNTFKFMKGELPRSAEEIFYEILSTHDKCHTDDEVQRHLQFLLDNMLKRLKQFKILDSDFIELILNIRNAKSAEEVNKLLINQEKLAKTYLVKKIRRYLDKIQKFEDKIAQYQLGKGTTDLGDQKGIPNELIPEAEHVLYFTNLHSFPDPIEQVLRGFARNIEKRLPRQKSD